ncbi:hypothetical protein L1987_85907 [Smallanthus sonchifolius]|uniref:Uncharacterized protein n=1 Tax=Smallanthus sonchifolius TaxID=185202 RepID=A0ACB8XXV2_9ASTR|nr:hypothetical protein L1987_85907 [Smallanthus sonchifolius]
MPGQGDPPMPQPLQEERKPFLPNSGETLTSEVNAGMATFVRISALIWADLLAAFAMYIMMNYLTNVWNLSTTHAAGIINIWNGITPVLAFTFAFIVDTFMGDFYMLVLSSIAYSVGL